MPPETNQAPTSQILPPPPLTPTKIGKFKASRIIIKESWAVLKQDKEIMWFPVVSALSTILVVFIMVAIFFLVVWGGNFELFKESSTQKLNDVYVYGILLIYYIVTFFVVNFFQAGLYIIVQARFSGQNLSFGDGINGAMKHFSKIFLWSLISATVGVILQIISDKSRIVGKIVASLLGAAWGILTYFSLPSLVIGNSSVKDSFKESASIIRKTWGETIIVNFGAGLFFGLLGFFLFAISVAIVILIPTWYIFIIVGILFVISLIVIAIVSSTLNSIFKLVLFNYARTGQVPQGFSADIVKSAVKNV